MEYKVINENEIIINGKKYIAVPAPNFGHCDGCDLLPNGKTSCGGLYQSIGGGEDSTLPYCSAQVRDDRREIIWRMKKQKQYRIVCDMEGRFSVQQYLENNWSGSWWEVHRCENRNEAGLNEARKWIDEQ